MGAVVALLGATTEAVRADGDAGRGKVLFAQQCAVCHTVEPEYHKEGPSLFQVFGRKAGTAPFFPHYIGLKGSSVVWDDQSLDLWLADPRAFLDGRDTGMRFRVPDPQQRADVIAYLKTLK